MALRQDLGLVLAAARQRAGLLLSIGSIVVRMVPQFRAMQSASTASTGCCASSSCGIRVVRAFVREPDEPARFAAPTTTLTETSLRAGRLMALMFPTVMLVLNVSSVAVVWFGRPGGRRGHAGRRPDRVPATSCTSSCR